MNDRVVEVSPLPDFRLRVRFQDGTEGTVSLKDDLYGPVFEPLRDPAFFERVDIDIRRHLLAERHRSRARCAL